MNNLNILINAYAVSPNWGSEPGLGWNWVINLAKYCRVFVITEGEWRTEIEKELTRLPQRDNIRFFYLPVSDRVRKMCWNQGDWRFYKYYRKWQESALKIAEKIISENHIDVIHQLNMIGFREPGSLWKIKDIPFVWGPVGGYGSTTLKYLKGQPLEVRIKAIVKNILNAIQGRYFPLSNKAMENAKVVFAANSDVYRYIKANFRDDVILLNETGCYEQFTPLEKHNVRNPFQLLWVGKFDYRKQLYLAIRIIHELSKREIPVVLKIIGDVENETYKKMSRIVERLGISDSIVWCGKIPNKRVHEMMKVSDLFLFTSISEGTPHVVLEAIQNNLPIICFDTCGQGDVVSKEIGVKIPIKKFSRSVTDFADAIENLTRSPERLDEMRRGCRRRQIEISWDAKCKFVSDIYARILDDAKQ